MVSRKLVVALLLSLSSTAVLYGISPETINCPSGTTVCAINANYGKWGCFNLNTSFYHCGECEIKCKTGQVCKAGSCVKKTTLQNNAALDGSFWQSSENNASGCQDGLVDLIIQTTNENQ